MDDVKKTTMRRSMWTIKDRLIAASINATKGFDAVKAIEGKKLRDRLSDALLVQANTATDKKSMRKVYEAYRGTTNYLTMLGMEDIFNNRNDDLFKNPNLVVGLSSIVDWWEILRIIYKITPQQKEKLKDIAKDYTGFTNHNVLLGKYMVSWMNLPSVFYFFDFTSLIPEIALELIEEHEVLQKIPHSGDSPASAYFDIKLLLDCMATNNLPSLGVVMKILNDKITQDVLSSKMNDSVDYLLKTPINNVQWLKRRKKLELDSRRHLFNLTKVDMAKERRVIFPHQYMFSFKNVPESREKELYDHYKLINNLKTVDVSIYKRGIYNDGVHGDLTRKVLNVKTNDNLTVDPSSYTKKPPRIGQVTPASSLGKLFHQAAINMKEKEAIEIVQRRLIIKSEVDNISIPISLDENHAPESQATFSIYKEKWKEFWWITPTPNLSNVKTVSGSLLTVLAHTFWRWFLKGFDYNLYEATFTYRWYYYGQFNRISLSKIDLALKYLNDWIEKNAMGTENAIETLPGELDRLYTIYATLIVQSQEHWKDDGVFPSIFDAYTNKEYGIYSQGYKKALNIKFDSILNIRLHEWFLSEELVKIKDNDDSDRFVSFLSINPFPGYRMFTCNTLGVDLLKEVYAKIWTPEKIQSFPSVLMKTDKNERFSAKAAIDGWILTSRDIKNSGEGGLVPVKVKSVYSSANTPEPSVKPKLPPTKTVVKGPSWFPKHVRVFLRRIGHAIDMQNIIVLATRKMREEYIQRNPNFILSQYGEGIEKKYADDVLKSLMLSIGEKRNVSKRHLAYARHLKRVKDHRFDVVIPIIETYITTSIVHGRSNEEDKWALSWCSTSHLTLINSFIQTCRDETKEMESFLSENGYDVDILVRNEGSQENVGKMRHVYSILSRYGKSIWDEIESSSINKIPREIRDPISISFPPDIQKFSGARNWYELDGGEMKKSMMAKVGTTNNALRDERLKGETREEYKQKTSEQVSEMADKLLHNTHIFTHVQGQFEKLYRQNRADPFSAIGNDVIVRQGKEAFSDEERLKHELFLNMRASTLGVLLSCFALKQTPIKGLLDSIVRNVSSPRNHTTMMPFFFLTLLFARTNAEAIFEILKGLKKRDPEYDTFDIKESVETFWEYSEDFTRYQHMLLEIGMTPDRFDQDNSLSLMDLAWELFEDRDNVNGGNISKFIRSGGLGEIDCTSLSQRVRQHIFMGPEGCLTRVVLCFLIKSIHNSVISPNLLLERGQVTLYDVTTDKAEAAREGITVPHGLEAIRGVSIDPTFNSVAHDLQLTRAFLLGDVNDNKIKSVIPSSNAAPILSKSIYSLIDTSDSKSKLFPSMLPPIEEHKAETLPPIDSSIALEHLFEYYLRNVSSLSS